MAYTYDYPRPAVTVDVVLLTPVELALQVLLIQRKQPPFQNQWALPGGFMDMDEELIDAARRELEEETGITVSKLMQIGTFGTFGRDPRGRTLSVAYLALYCDNRKSLQAGDDAAAARWFNTKMLSELAFDHAEILAAALQQLQQLAKEPEKLCHDLLVDKQHLPTILSAINKVSP